MVFIVVALSVFSPISSLVAQEEKQGTEVAESTITKEEKYILTLKTMIGDMHNLRKQIAAKEKALSTAQLQVDKTSISEEINKIAGRLHALERDFDQVATGIDLAMFDEKPQTAFKWEDEVLDLLRPIILEAKKMTARPRQIEKLRNDIAYYEARLPILQKATENIDLLMAQAKDSTLKNEFLELKKVWSDRQEQTMNQMTTATLKLEELTREKKSALDSLSELFELFFKSRGKNLLLATAAFLGVFFMLRLMHRFIYRVSPIHRNRPVYIRIFDVLYHLGTGLGSTVAFILVLYAFGDWVLITLISLFLLGFVWAAKRNIMQFWKEIKLLLNLGAVRENERLIYHGVPWKVVSLNLYSELENPSLKSRLRLPLAAFMELTSYPCGDEPWFPCREKEWVILSDGTRGEVVSQTHEMVQLALRGGAFKTYSTQDFLAQAPLNISHNFRLKVVFGIDYKHQADCTRKIPEQLGKTVTEKLGENGFGDDLIDLRVDFKTAAASSLDFEIIADFNGRSAPAYGRLIREIQRFCVDACNEFGWEIPFTQVTLHQA
jgi:small-conductance mechanosensitive channel